MITLIYFLCMLVFVVVLIKSVFRDGNRANRVNLNPNQTTQGGSDDVHKLETLNKYKELFEKGIISEEVYTEKKRLYLSNSIQEKSETEAMAPQDSKEMKDWICPTCGAENQPERTSCYFCRSEKV